MNKPTPKKLTLRRETLRELTKAELKLVAGGGAKSNAYSCKCPKK